MEIPHDGWLIQQSNPVGGRNAAESRNALRHQFLFIHIKGIATYIAIFAVITGLVLLCINKRRVSFAPAELELPKESCFKIVYVNVGMILLLVGCVALILANVIPL